MDDAQHRGGPRWPGQAGDGDGGGAARGLIGAHVLGNVGVVTLSRPGKHNAMTQEMWTALPELLDSLASVPDVVSIVIRGAGESFSAGADLSEVLAATASLEAATAYCTTVVDALLALANCPKPTIAVVKGVASGGGAELALAADLRFAEESSYLQLPMARIGVVPDDFTVRRLVSLGGPAVARLMLFGAQPIPARRCLDMGLFDVVVPQSRLDDVVDEHVNAFSKASAYAIREIKAQLVSEESNCAAGDLAAGMAQSFVTGDVEKFAHMFMSKTGSHSY